MRTVTLIIAFAGTVIAANWALATFGIVPIGFGLMAPAGVFFAGLAFTLRDFLHESGGRRWVLVAIAIGALVSLGIEDARQIAIASAVAFTLSELADYAVYAPLRERGWIRAVVASNVVGMAVDSALFLWLAFDSLAFIEGQLVGKFYMTALAVVFISGWRGRDLLVRRGTA